jgi:hypothetical protein
MAKNRMTLYELLHFGCLRSQPFRMLRRAVEVRRRLEQFVLATLRRGRGLIQNYRNLGRGSRLEPGRDSDRLILSASHENVYFSSGSLRRIATRVTRWARRRANRLRPNAL